MKALFLSVAFLLCCCFVPSNASASQHLVSHAVVKAAKFSVKVVKVAAHDVYAAAKFLI